MSLSFSLLKKKKAFNIVVSSCRSTCVQVSHCLAQDHWSAVIMSVRHAMKPAGYRIFFSTVFVVLDLLKYNEFQGIYLYIKALDTSPSHTLQQ